MAALDITDQIETVLRGVPDPEIPVVNIVELGMVREICSDHIVLTTTYIGCPATDMIFADTRAALDRAGFADVQIKTELSPAWTTDWLEAGAKEKLRSYGIAPPNPRTANEPRPSCPLCGAQDTQMVSRFGSTPCKSHHTCNACLEPFDAFKCH